MLVSVRPPAPRFYDGFRRVPILFSPERVRLNRSTTCRLEGEHVPEACAHPGTLGGQADEIGKPISVPAAQVRVASEFAGTIQRSQAIRKGAMVFIFEHGPGFVVMFDDVGGASRSRDNSFYSVPTIKFLERHDNRIWQAWRENLSQ